MPRLLIAASPVEIDAKADELGLPPEAREVARRMFHHLTDLLGKSVIALEVQHKEWPQHRFYFGTDGSEMHSILGDLARLPGVLDVTAGVAARQPDLKGLYIREQDGTLVGILVGRETHEGFDLPA